MLHFLPRTKIDVIPLAKSKSDFDSWQYFRDYHLIGTYAPSTQVGNSLPAVLGPFTASERKRWKQRATSLSDKFIQLRYDTSSEMEGVDIDEQSTGQTFFFGNTRQDRARAIKHTLRNHSWNHAVVLHEANYSDDSSMSCNTLQREFGCICNKEASSSDLVDGVKYWCLNVDGVSAEELESGGAISRVIKMLTPEDYGEILKEQSDFFRVSFVNSSISKTENMTEPRNAWTREGGASVLPNIVILGS